MIRRMVACNSLVASGKVVTVLAVVVAVRSWFESFEQAVMLAAEPKAIAVMYDDSTGKVDAPVTGKSFNIIPLSEIQEMLEFSST